MSRSITTTRCRKAFLLLTLISVLLQVQSVFACQMMETSGPVKDCCCDDPVERTDILGSNQTSDADPCCDFSLEISLKELDTGSAPFWSPAQQPDHDPPTALFIHKLVGCHLSITRCTLTFYNRTNPLGSGTHTYLDTLRLRI